MIFGEILALVALLGATGFGITAILSWASKRDRADKEYQAKHDRMQQDLRKALESRDYRKLDDWMLIYADELDEGVRKQVQIRRDELYVESNS